MGLCTCSKWLKDFNDKHILTRINVAIMMFAACFASFMYRVHVSIIILAMTRAHECPENSTTCSFGGDGDHGPRYNWNIAQESSALAIFFVGFMVTTGFAGFLADFLGGSTIIVWTIFLSAVVTSLLPLAASLGLYYFLVARFIIGGLCGVLFPACHNLIAKWSPPNEKGKFVATFMGGTFGVVVTLPLAGLIVETLGWVYAYYIASAFGIVVAIFWWFLVANSPAEHPRITTEEKEYIENAVIGVNKDKSSMPPLLSLLTSAPFWALLVLHFGSMWGLMFVQTNIPKYMTQILDFNLTRSGFLSALPNLARLISGIIFGTIGDVIRRKQLMGITKIRKFFTIFSHIIPGIFLICLVLAKANTALVIACLTLSLGFNGAATVTNLQNSQDLAPNYAASIYGLINFTGCAPGFINPTVVTYFTKNGNTREAWNPIFYIAAAFYIGAALFFLLFGSGEVQPWNYIENTDGSGESVTSPPQPATK